MGTEILRQGVSLAVGAASFGVALILWFLVRGRTKKPKVEAWIDRGILALMLTAAVGLTGTFLGSWTRAGIGWVNHLLSRWVGPQLGPFVLIGIALALVIAVAFALFEANVAGKTLTATWLTPFTATAIPGPVGAFVVSGITALTGLAATGIGLLFGIH